MDDLETEVYWKAKKLFQTLLSVSRGLTKALDELSDDEKEIIHLMIKKGEDVDCE